MRIYLQLFVIFYFFSFFQLFSSEKADSIKTINEDTLSELDYSDAQLAQELIDSIQADWWTIIQECKDPNDFSPVIKWKLCDFPCSDNMKDIYLSPKEYLLFRWMEILKDWAKIKYFVGVGSTVYIEVSNRNRILDEIPNSRSPLGTNKYECLNYTQCVAALTWYEINRNSISLDLFLLDLGRNYVKNNEIIRERVSTIKKDFTPSQNKLPTMLSIRSIFNLWAAPGFFKNEIYNR